MFSISHIERGAVSLSIVVSFNKIDTCDFLLYLSSQLYKETLTICMYVDYSRLPAIVGYLVFLICYEKVDWAKPEVEL